MRWGGYILFYEGMPGISWNRGGVPKVHIFETRHYSIAGERAGVQSSISWAFHQCAAGGIWSRFGTIVYCLCMRSGCALCDYRSIMGLPGIRLGLWLAGGFFFAGACYLFTLRVSGFSGDCGCGLPGNVSSYHPTLIRMVLNSTMGVVCLISGGVQVFERRKYAKYA